MNSTSNLAEATQTTEEQTTLDTYQQRAAVLIPSDDLTVRQCAEFIEECKLAEKRVESRRKDKVDPLNAEVKEINALYMPVRDAFKALWVSVDTRLSKYLYEQQQKAQIEQQRLIDEAKRKQAEEDAKAEAARKAAEAARQAGDDKLAAKLDAKADKAEVKASMITAPVVHAPDRTMDLGGHTLSVSAPKKDWMLPGWDKTSKLYGDDPRLKGIDPAWLLRFCVLDAVRLNAAFKSGESFPSPFSTTERFGGAILRSSK